MYNLEQIASFWKKGQTVPKTATNKEREKNDKRHKDNATIRSKRRQRNEYIEK